MLVTVRSSDGWRDLDLTTSSISDIHYFSLEYRFKHFTPVDVPYYIKTFTWYDYYIGDVHYTSDQLLAHLSKHYPEFLI